MLQMQEQIRLKMTVKHQIPKDFDVVAIFYKVELIIKVEHNQLDRPCLLQNHFRNEVTSTARASRVIAGCEAADKHSA